MLFLMAIMKFPAGGNGASPLMEPLMELVHEARVTNFYLRHHATARYKYTTSQATQHQDPNFKKALIEVSLPAALHASTQAVHKNGTQVFSGPFCSNVHFH
jgi:hypothetical protein